MGRGGGGEGGYGGGCGSGVSTVAGGVWGDEGVMVGEKESELVPRSEEEVIDAAVSNLAQRQNCAIHSAVNRARQKKS